MCTSSVDTHSVTVEGVEDAGHVAAQDAHRDAGVVQRQPAAACLLRAVAREQVIAHRTQHAHLGQEGTVRQYGPEHASMITRHESRGLEEGG